MGIIKILRDLQHLHRMAIGEFWDFLNDAMNWQKRFGTGLLAFNENTRLRIAKVDYNDFKIFVYSAIHRSRLKINISLSLHFLYVFLLVVVINGMNPVYREALRWKSAQVK